MGIDEWIVLAIFWLGIQIVIVIIGYECDLTIFNPVKNYERWTSLNWFGVAFFTLALNIVCPVLAFCYWFWKLCTVGRKR